MLYVWTSTLSEVIMQRRAEADLQMAKRGLWSVHI